MTEIEWRNRDVPVSKRFDDPYYSLDDGLAEARYVFLRGNALPRRFRDGFHIAELGFGTGLNLLSALQMWRASGNSGVLQFTSFEAFPLSSDDMRRALEPFEDLNSLAEELSPHWGHAEIELPDLRFRLVEGAARITLPAWSGRADAWFLDGFSPAKNPELWQAALLNEVAAHTSPGGTAATYTAAGAVRRALAAAGFDVSRVPGYGRKRHMSVAVKP